MNDEIEQVRFLSTYLGSKPSKKDTKASLVAKIREKYLFTEGARMTNVKKSVFKHASLYIRYDYLRQLTSFIPERSSKAHLLSLRESPSSLIHFTQSGQAAILQALGFLKLKGYKSILSLTHLYWETEQTLDLLGFTMSSSADIFWIDSSSFDVSAEWSVPVSTKWVVVDSTCWPVLGEEFKTLREKLKAYDVITVRSHVKLDMLGVEYAPLGSITLSSEQNAPHGVPFYEASRLFSTTASPESIPPYLLDSKNLKFSLKRVRDFRKTHKIVCEIAQKESAVTIQCPPHGLYFYMAFKNNTSDLSSIQKKALIIGETCEIDLRHLESFGFDFFGLQVFKPKRDRDFELCLRVAYGATGVPKSRMKKLIEGLKTISA